MVEHRSPKPGVAGSIPVAPARVGKMMNPLKYLRQVRQEANKVTWATRKETYLTTIMVLILGAIAAVFFFGVDKLIEFTLRFFFE